MENPTNDTSISRPVDSLDDTLDDTLAPSDCSPAPRLMSPPPTAASQVRVLGGASKAIGGSCSKRGGTGLPKTPMGEPECTEPSRELHASFAELLPFEPCRDEPYTVPGGGFRASITW